MPLSRRAKRSVFLVILLVVGGVLGVVGVREALRWRQAQLIERSRTDGLAASRAGDHAEAVRILGSALRSLRDDHEVVFALATSRLALEEEDGSHVGAAGMLFARAAELKADDLESRRRILEIFPRLGFLRETLDAADEIIALEPLDQKARSTRIQVLASLGRWSESADESSYMVMQEPGNAEWKRLQLSLLLASGRSVEEVLEVTSQWPANPNQDGFDDLMKAALLRGAGRLDESGTLVDLAVAAGARTQDRLEAMVSVLSDMGAPNRAKELIWSSLAVQTDWTAGLARFAATWCFDAADRACLVELLDRVGDDADARREVLARIVLLSVFAGADDIDGWVAALAEASPTQGSIGAMALVSARIATRFDRADYELLQATARAAPNDSVALLVRAWASQSVGDLSSALEVLRQAQTLDPSLSAQMLQVECLRASGQRDRSLEMAIDLVTRFPGRGEPLLLLCLAWAEHPEVEAQLINRLAALTGSRDALQFAEQLSKIVGLEPVATPMLTAAIAAGRWDVVEDLVAIALERPRSRRLLMTLYERLSLGNPELAVDVATALRESFADDPMVAAAMVRDSGQLQQLRESLDLDAGNAGERSEAWLLLLAATESLGDAEFVQLAREALQACPDDPRVMNRLLGDPRCWSDESVVSDVIARLEKSLGEDSTSVTVARANWVLSFRPDDVVARDEMLTRLADLTLKQPDSLTANVTLLRLLSSDRKSDPQAAIRLGRRILASNPRAREVYPMVIDLMQRQGMLEESNQLLEEFERLDSSGVLAARQRAEQSVREGNFDRLVLALADVASRSGEGADLVNLGRVREGLGDLKGAEDAYRQAIERSESAVDATYRLALLYARQGLVEQAEQLLTTDELPIDEGRREMVLGTLLVQGGRIEDGIVRLRTATKVLPADAEAWRLLAASLSLADRQGEAMTIAMEGLRAVPESEELAGVLLGTVLADGTQLTAFLQSEGFQQLPPAVVESARILDASFDRGVGVLRPSEAQLREARELCGRWEDSLVVWRTAIALHSAAGQVAESRALAAAAAREFPNAPEVWEWQVRMAAASGDIEAGVGLCREWRRAAFPNVAPVDEMQAVLELGRGRADRAVELLRPHVARIERMASDDPGPYRSLLGALIISGNVREAFRIEGPRLSTSPIARQVWSRLASMGSYESGLEAISLLESVSPSDPRGRSIMAGTWIEFHRRHPDGVGLDRARLLLPRELPSPSTAEGRLLLVAFAEHAKVAGDPAQEHRLLRQVIDATPAEAWSNFERLGSLPEDERTAVFVQVEPALYARNNLAMSLLHEQGDLAEALRLIDECIAVMPDEPNLRDSRSQVLLAMGRLSEAETEIVLALRRSPTNIPFLLSAAEVLVALGRVEDARLTINRVQEMVSQEPWPTQELEDRLAKVRSQLDG